MQVTVILTGNLSISLFHLSVNRQHRGQAFAKNLDLLIFLMILFLYSGDCIYYHMAHHLSKLSSEHFILQFEMLLIMIIQFAFSNLRISFIFLLFTSSTLARTSEISFMEMLVIE